MANLTTTNVTVNLLDESANILTDDAVAGGLSAINFTDSSPVLGTPALSVPTSNVVVFSDRSLDLGISILSTECNALFLCSSEPTDYATALSLQLATKTGTIFGSPAAATLGRKVVSNAITDGSCVANGTVTQWAGVDTTNTRLLVHGPVNTSHSVISGQKFIIPSFTLEFDRG